MSNSIKDGGPAFPGLQYSDEKGDVIVSYGSGGRGVAIPRGSFPGMSLRDYFAGQAMVALISLNEIHIEPEDLGKTMGDIIAKQSFGYADAMLAAREKKI